MDAAFRAYLDKVRAHRAELRESAAAVDTALAGPLGRREVWLEQVRARLAELAHDFRVHVELTEGEGGLYADVRRGSPRLSGPADRLVAEHVSLAARMDELLDVLAAGERVRDVAELREDVTALVGQLVRHRQKGSDLVYEAYEVDIGGSG